MTIFLESACDDPAVIAANVALKVSSGDPDYKDMSREKAKQDFLRRIKEYEAVYETITEPHLSYLRIKNVTLSYTFPKHLIRKLTLSQLKLFVSIENLATFSSLPKGIDPETLSWSYPAFRTVSFGINLSL